MTNNKSTLAGKMTQYRWVICAMLFFATTVNYLDRQVLSLTWDEFIKPEFHWNEYHYGLITSIFSIVYAVCMLFAGRFIDWMGTKKGYLWAIGVWSMGACMHALCGIATEAWVGLPDAAALRAVEAGSALAATIAMVSMYFFIAARCILALGEAGNFPAAIKVTAEYFPKKDRAYDEIRCNHNDPSPVLVRRLGRDGLYRRLQRRRGFPDHSGVFRRPAVEACGVAHGADYARRLSREGDARRL